jgi:arylsulfatase A-like enzyme
VTNVDFARTLLDAAGVPPHPRMQGRSFWPDVTGHEHEVLPAAEGVYYRYWEHDDPSHQAPAHYGYSDGRHKLIYFYNDGLGVPGCGPHVYPPEWELYDLVADPDEVRNVADDAAYADVRCDLERRLWDALAAVGDEPHPSHPAPTDSADP